MIGCVREASQHVTNARASSCKQTLFGGINLACMIRYKPFPKQINKKTNDQMKE